MTRLPGKAGCTAAIGNRQVRPACRAAEQRALPSFRLHATTLAPEGSTDTGVDELPSGSRRQVLGAVCGVQACTALQTNSCPGEPKAEACSTSVNRSPGRSPDQRWAKCCGTGTPCRTRLRGCAATVSRCAHLPTQRRLGSCPRPLPQSVSGRPVHKSPYKREIAWLGPLPQDSAAPHGLLTTAIGRPHPCVTQGRGHTAHTPRGGAAGWAAASRSDGAVRRGAESSADTPTRHCAPHPRSTSTRPHSLPQVARAQVALERVAAAAGPGADPGAVRLQQYALLMALRETNAAAFFSLVGNDVERWLPVIYTPTVGDACSRWGSLLPRPTGLYLSLADAGRVAQRLAVWAQAQPQVGQGCTPGPRRAGLWFAAQARVVGAVVAGGCRGVRKRGALGVASPAVATPSQASITVITDGERILGLGDLVGLQGRRRGSRRAGTRGSATVLSQRGVATRPPTNTEPRVHCTC
jgi:hypothetical protein